MKQYFVLFGLLLVLAGCVPASEPDSKPVQLSFSGYDGPVYRGCTSAQDCRTLLLVQDAEDCYEEGAQESSAEDDVVLLSSVGEGFLKANALW